MTVMNQLIRGVAFAPSDEEIGNFLAARPVAAHHVPTWLEAGGAITPTPAPDATEARIRSLLGQGQSLRAVQRELFGYTGGAAYEAVKAVHEQMRLH
jgi:hypothetical protein